MENQHNHFSSPRTPLSGEFSHQEIFALGTEFLQGLNKQGLSAIQIRFLAECFITKKHQYLPKELLQYLQDHPDEFQRVIDSSEEVLPIASPPQQKVFIRIAALLVLGLGLIFLWYAVRPGSDSTTQPHNQIISANKKKKSTLDSTTNQGQKKEKKQDIAFSDTLKKSKQKPSIPKQPKPLVTQPDYSSFAHYVALRSRFQDEGIRLRYQLGGADTRTVNEDTLSKQMTVLLPQKVSWSQIHQTISFTLQSKTNLSDTLRLFIRIEDNQRNVLQTLKLQKTAPTHWQCQWKPTKIGLYYWQFQQTRNDIRQPTGKVYIGEKKIVDKLYKKFPQLLDF